VTQATGEAAAEIRSQSGAHWEVRRPVRHNLDVSDLGSTPDHAGGPTFWRRAPPDRI